MIDCDKTTARPSSDLKDKREIGMRELAALGKPPASLILPPADTKRWSSRRKAAIVIAIRQRVLTREEACEHYLLSKEELDLWEAAFDKGGVPGLRISSLRRNRPAMQRPGMPRQG